jgi:hypothetical protein
MFCVHKLVYKKDCNKYPKIKLLRHFDMIMQHIAENIIQQMYSFFVSYKGNLKKNNWNI